jgi:hypothetical protein
LVELPPGRCSCCAHRLGRPVCSQAVVPGEELLLDYGAGYINMHFETAGEEDDEDDSGFAFQRD